MIHNPAKQLNRLGLGNFSKSTLGSFLMMQGGNGESLIDQESFKSVAESFHKPLAKGSFMEDSFRKQNLVQNQSSFVLM